MDGSKILFMLGSFLSSLFQMYVYYIFFSAVLKKKNISPLYFFISFFCAEIVNFLINTVIAIPYITNASMIVEIVLITFLLYDGKWHIKVFASLLIVTFGAVIETAIVLFFELVLHTSMEMILNNPVIQFEARVVSIIVNFLVVTLLMRFKRSEHRVIPVYYSLVLMLIPIITMFLIYQLLIMNYTEKLSYSIIFSTVGIMGINIIIYALFEALMRQSEIELRHKLTSQQYELQIKHYEQLIDNRRKILEMIHDFKNHIIAIEALASENKMLQLWDYLHEIKKDTGNILKTVDTGHPVIDAVLDEKKHVANEAGIDMSIKVMLPEKFGVKNVDICIVLGNAIDNAIEACQKIADESIKKEISVKLFVNKVYLVIVISNTTAGSKTTTMENNMEKKLLHGYGLNNIKHTVEKYGGNMQITQTEHSFTLNLIMQTEQMKIESNV